MSEGFSYVDLPQQWQIVSARGTYCKVSSFTNEWAKDNLKGTFVLIKYLFSREDSSQLEAKIITISNLNDKKI